MNQLTAIKTNQLTSINMIEMNQLTSINMIELIDWQMLSSRQKKES